MNLKQIATILAMASVIWGAAWYVRGVEQDIKGNKEVIRELQQTQTELKKLVEREQLERMKKEAERKVYRELCNQGRLPPEDCQD